MADVFLPDPGVPGVRSMVLGVSKSVRMGPLVETLLMMIPTKYYSYIN